MSSPASCNISVTLLTNTSSCCIDKTSTAELSEAINSMFWWYQGAKICYAYWVDVADDALADPSDCSSFTGSHWCTRGWTLQELIAPRDLIFFSRTWQPLGTKWEMASPGSILSWATRIDNKFLVSTDHFWHLGYDAPSIAQIMSWAADRETTRTEDQAYCLLGLSIVGLESVLVVSLKF